MKIKAFLFNKMDFFSIYVAGIIIKGKNSTLLTRVILLGLKNLSFNMNFVEYNIKT